GTSCTSYYEQNSDDLTLHLPDQIAQPTTLLPLSSSLQFVHDVPTGKGSILGGCLTTVSTMF
ncbi:unnamed protein product, partial [Rotaria sp. Silwood2]